MEHCSDFKHSKQAEIKIKNTAAIIARVFMILFVLSAIGLLAYLGVSVYSFISNNDASLLSIFYPTIQLTTACVTLRLMYALFRNIANGKSPLTKKHATILAIIASLLHCKLPNRNCHAINTCSKRTDLSQKSDTCKTLPPAPYTLT